MTEDNNLTDKEDVRLVENIETEDSEETKSVDKNVQNLTVLNVKSCISNVQAIGKLSVPIFLSYLCIFGMNVTDNIFLVRNQYIFVQFFL
jgi:hypothetical protein